MVLYELLSGTKDMDTKDYGKSSRPVRSRRYTRRSFIAGHRPLKRLFTPEIKRYLKDWLVRRRENPYPNREEKKCLAQETGLTYIQICNWFANWRRKLKNVNADRNQRTWGHLIRTYNDQAHGNVEQFSICSDDSIWSENGHYDQETESSDLSASQEEDARVNDDFEVLNNNTFKINSNMEKDTPSPVLLSKWLESAARFQPSENNYSCWAEDRRRRPTDYKQRLTTLVRHGRDEVEAAVALTTLATASARNNSP